MTTGKATARLIAFLLFAAPAALAASELDFFRAPLGSGASIDIPTAWKIATSDQRIAIGRRMQADGYHANPAGLSFAAWYSDAGGKVIASLASWTSTDGVITQEKVREFTQRDLENMEAMELQNAGPAVKAAGIKVSNPSHLQKRVLNGMQVLVSEATQLYFGETQPVRVRGVQLFNGARTLTVVFTYRELDADALRPTIDLMLASLQQHTRP